MTDTTTQCLPHSIPAEKAVLCLMLDSPTEAFPAIAEHRITEEHFYIPGHQTIFQAMHAMRAAELDVELVGLLQWLHDHGDLDRCGGPSEVASLLGYVATPAHIRRHMDILREKWEARAIIHTCTETVQKIYDSPGEVGATMAGLTGEIESIRDACQQAAKLQTTKELVQGLITDLQSAFAGNPPTRGISTGFEEFDAMTGGLKPGEMIIVAARPSMGKTALMTNIVEHVAIDRSVAVYVASLEMTAKQVASRIAYTRAGLSQRAVEANTAAVTKADLARIQAAFNDLLQSRLTIDDEASMTIAELRAKVRRANQANPLCLVAVDYLQLMRSKSRQAENSREREIGEISSGLKAMAKELAIPVLVLAQLNRDSEKRSTRGEAKGIPRMSDLRESGNIEQDADIIGLLHRDDYFSSPEEKQAAADKNDIEGRARLIVAKNRNGPTGTCWLTWIAEEMRFRGGAPAPDPAQYHHQKSRRYDGE